MSDYSSTQEERHAAADCLSRLIDASEQVAQAMLGTPPSGVLERDPARKLNTAARLVSLHRAVAAGHLASFTALLAHPASHGPSLATLDRSFLETWARAWWVMDAPTSTRAEYRARAMTVDELEAGVKRGITLLSTESMVEAIKRATRDRDTIKLAAAEVVPRPPALVKQLLQDCDWSLELATATYSHLSGVAHGESVFTESLTEQPQQTILFSGVALPRDNLFKYCKTLMDVTVVATSRLIQVWGLSAADQDAFLQEAAAVAKGLQAAYRGMS